jgi:hypothetical protein
MMALIVVGGVVGLVLILFCFREAVTRYWIGDSSSCTFWFWWPHDDDNDVVESVVAVVESSPGGVNKDKLVASMLVDMRVHNADGVWILLSRAPQKRKVVSPKRKAHLQRRRSNCRWSSLMTLFKRAALSLQATMMIPMSRWTVGPKFPRANCGSA